MGLDMYLMKKIPNNEDVELIYWRKANQVFNWFDRNCANNAIENCVPVPVSTYDLMNLLKDVNAVLEDNSKSKELLPTTSGFFLAVQIITNGISPTSSIRKRSSKKCCAT